MQRDNGRWDDHTNRVGNKVAAGDREERRKIVDVSQKKVQSLKVGQKGIVAIKCHDKDSGIGTLVSPMCCCIDESRNFFILSEYKGCETAECGVVLGLRMFLPV